MNWLSRLSLQSLWVRRLIGLLFVAAILQLGAAVARLFLPGESLERIEQEAVNYYRSFPFDRAFAIRDAPKESRTAQPEPDRIYELTNLTIKGIYAESDGGGFVVVQEGKEVHFIGHQEVFQGYRLVRIEARRALFERDGRQYELKLQSDGPQAQVRRSASRAPAPAPASKDRPQQIHSVTRDEIERYRQDARLIWDNIGILPVSENGDFKEFRVTFVAPGSVFAQLGLQEGDVLKEANGIKLDGYAAALRLYAEIDRMDAFKLVIERNNQTRELEYEIR
jgi:general secretion pathway protein C